MRGFFRGRLCFTLFQGRKTTNFFSLCLRVFPSHLPTWRHFCKWVIFSWQASGKGEEIAIFTSRHKWFTPPVIAFNYFWWKWWMLIFPVLFKHIVPNFAKLNLFHKRNRFESSTTLHREIWENESPVLCLYAWLHVLVNECVIVHVGLGREIKGRPTSSVCTGLNFWAHSKLETSGFPFRCSSELQHAFAGNISKMCGWGNFLLLHFSMWPG